jgi:hypothetical protein
MKLYTEEQVRQMFYEGSKYAASISPASLNETYNYIDKKIDSLKPIELPSDDDIEKELLKHSNITQIDPYKPFYFNAAMFGAKWVIEQIKQHGNE